MLKYSSAAVALLSALALAACGSSSSNSSSSSSSSSAPASTATSAASGSTGTTAATSSASGAVSNDGSEKVSYSDPTGAQVGQQQIFQGFKQGAGEIGWSASQIDAALSSTKQVSDIATMLNEKQNGIASWTLDQGAAQGAYESAAKAGVPVIGINSTGAGIKTTVWWQINTCGANSPIYQTAQYIVKAFPHAKALVIGGPPVPSIEAYVACFKQAAKKYGIDIEAEQNNTNDTASAAQPIVAALLTKYPSTQVIWSYNDDSALGASAALAAAGKSVWTGSGTSAVMDLGQNGDADAITAIKQGRETATWDPNNVASGLALVKALSYYIGPKKVATPPKQLVVKSIFWTKANIASYKGPSARGYSMSNIPLVK
jgi:ribose transport system substrate-binding protein